MMHSRHWEGPPEDSFAATSLRAVIRSFHFCSDILIDVLTFISKKEGQVLISELLYATLLLTLVSSLSFFGSSTHIIVMQGIL
jgi:hypothetical protein